MLVPRVFHSLHPPPQHWSCCAECLSLIRCEEELFAADRHLLSPRHNLHFTAMSFYFSSTKAFRVMRVLLWRKGCPFTDISTQLPAEEKDTNIRFRFCFVLLDQKDSGSVGNIFPHFLCELCGSSHPLNTESLLADHLLLLGRLLDVLPRLYSNGKLDHEKC